MVTNHSDDEILGFLGEFAFWGVLCGIGAALVFLLRRHPLIASISLGVVGLGVASIAFLATIQTKPERSWLRYAEAATVAVVSAASVLWILRYACSCP